MKAQNRYWIAGIVIFIVVLAGAYMINQPQKKNEQTAPSSPAAQIGVLDTQKAIKAHPKYQETVDLKKDINRLTAQMDNLARFHGETKPSGLPEVPMTGLYDAANQKLNQQMAEKYAALNEQLKQKEKELYERFSAELDQEIAAVDEQYVPEIFNLQLKLKTLRMSEEAHNETQQKMQALQQERAEKSAEKQRQFAARMNEQMKIEQDKAQAELSEYGKQLRNAQAGMIEQEKKAIDERNQAQAQQDAGATVQEQMKNLQNDLMEKEQKLRNLQEEIVADVSSHTARLALQKGLHTVIANVRLNINAVDLTEAVIEEFNKS